MAFDYLPHTVTIARKNTGAGIRRTTANVAVGVKTFIQPLDPQASRQYQLSFGKGFRAFFEQGIDVRDGDRLTDQNAEVYTVVGVRHHDYGSQPHINVALQKEMEPGDNG